MEKTMNAIETARLPHHGTCPRRLGRGAALAALCAAQALALPACDALDDPPEVQRATPESVVRVGSALTESASGEVGSSQAQLLLIAADPANCKLVVAGNTGTFTPSPKLDVLLKHKVFKPFAVPDKSVNLPDPLSGVAWVQPVNLAVDTSTADVEIDGDAMVLSVGGSGSFHVHTPSPLPDADVSLQSVNVTVRLSWNRFVQRFYVASSSSVAVDLKGQVTVAGINFSLPASVGQSLAAAVVGPINDALNDQSIADAFAGQLAQYWSILHGSGWSVNPATITIGGDVIDFPLTRLIPPSVPHCFSGNVCADQVQIICDEVPGIYDIERVATDGSLQLVSSVDNRANNNRPDVTDYAPIPTTVAGVSATRYVVCNSDPGGRKCTPTIAVPLSTFVCGGGGTSSSGGNAGGGPLPPPPITPGCFSGYRPIPCKHLLE